MKKVINKDLFGGEIYVGDIVTIDYYCGEGVTMDCGQNLIQKK